MRLFFIVFILIASQSVQSQIWVPAYFTDHMVLQQHSSIPFNGKASPNSEIIIECSWNKKKQFVKVGANGEWETNIKTEDYGGPYTIKILQNEKEIFLIEDLLIGEVWFCSGQSNMEMPLGGWGQINSYEQEIADANYPKIRFLQIEHNQSEIPLADLKLNKNWQVCEPSSIEDFSATAYFFARKIYKETGIPIGLIHSSWGGTVIEAWTSGESLKTINDFDKDLAALTSDKIKKNLIKIQQDSIKKWNTLLSEKNKIISRDWVTEHYDDTEWENINLPGFWEDAEIGLNNFDGILYFRKYFDLTNQESYSDVNVTYLADDNDRLWVNGNLIGETQGYNVTSNFTLPDSLLHPGRNQLVIEVFDGGNQGGIYGDESSIFLQTSSKKINLSGEWKFHKSIDLNDFPVRPNFPIEQYRPSVLFNAMVHPFINIPLAGVIWYQGESNVERADQYRTLFPLLIKDWRRQFQQKDLPFYYVQLANFQKAKKTPPANSEWAELRDAQLQTLKLSNTGMAVTIDIGDANDIHPKNKQEVGRRLALLALKDQYGKDIISSGPMLKSFKIHNNFCILTFSNVGEGLKFEGKQLKGFQISDVEGHFVFSKAELVNKNTVKVYSDEILHPKVVRYNWESNPDGNLINSAGLPASPFRTK